MQHYVPQFYLRRFVNLRKNSYYLYAYSKPDSKQFYVNIARAQELGGVMFFPDIVCLMDEGGLHTELDLPFS